MLGLKRRNHVVLIALMLIMSLVAMGCGGAEDPGQNAGQNADESDVIKIGVYEPLTGVNAAGGQMTLEGIELAREMYPEILGKKVEIVTVDNKSEKQEAANAVERLITQENVNLIIGSYGSSLAATDVLNAKTAAIIQDVQQDYSVGLSSYFEKAFKATNGDDSIVAKVNYNTGDKDFSAQLTEVKSKNPDVIFAPLIN